MDIRLGLAGALVGTCNRSHGGSNQSPAKVLIRTPMNYRKLRIAWSIGCGILCLLLILLWVRSYWRWDILESTTNWGLIHRQSLRGVLVYEYRAVNVKPHVPATTRALIIKEISIGSAFSSRPVSAGESYRIPGNNSRFLGFGYFNSGSTVIAVVPYWFAVMLFGMLGTLPWLRYRFSLRTLLIATTLVAVGLGLIFAL
jgi:hypothetical protein